MERKKLSRNAAYIDTLRQATNIFGTEAVQPSSLSKEDLIIAHDWIREQNADYGQVDPRLPSYRQHRFNL